MKCLTPYFALVLLAIFSHSVAGQGFSSTTQTARGTGQSISEQGFGKDFWFAPIANDTSVAAYFLLNILSTDSGTANIQLGTSGTVSKVTLKPNVTSTFTIPNSWIVRSSAIAENKAIHVWSNAPLVCHEMSHNDYSSDGMLLIPSSDFGTKYVVAAYAPLFEGGGGGSVYDLPSEFTIVGTHDNTQVTVIGSIDLRKESSTACCSCIAAQKGTPTTFVINAGQAMQFKNTCVQDCDNFDPTGTIVSANYPIGLSSGSDCVNIPCDFPYCDHLCEMIPPTSAWGHRYVTIPFDAGSAPSHSQYTMLVIASKAGQKIYTTGSDGNKTLYCVLGAGQSYWRNDVSTGLLWESDTAFLLVQYMNSASYPDNVNGWGDPSQMIVPSTDQFSRTVLFQTAGTVGNEASYSNYVNIIAKYNDNVMIDGKSMGTADLIPIDNNYVGYRVKKVAKGAHIVTSNFGVGVTCYGYGYDEAYAWPGNLKVTTPVVSLADTVAPIAVITSPTCQSMHVVLTDSGASASKVRQPEIGSIVNVEYDGNTSWKPGDNGTYYDANVIDPAKPGSLDVTVYDFAGNSILIHSTYVPTFAARMTPDVQDFGNSDTSVCTFRFDSLINTGAGSYNIGTLKLAHGDRGFSIDSAATTPLQQGETRRIKICFRPTNAGTAYDTLLMTGLCYVGPVYLQATAGPKNFVITDHDFGTVPLGDSVEGTALIINQSSTLALTIDSIWVDDPWNFQVTGQQVLSIPPLGIDTAHFVFHTNQYSGEGKYSMPWHAFSNAVSLEGESGIRDAKLTANVVSAGVNSAASGSYNVRLISNPVNNGATIVLSGSDVSHTSALRFELDDVLGHSLLNGSPQIVAVRPDRVTVRIDMADIPNGSYFLRLINNGLVTSTKIMISH